MTTINGASVGNQTTEQIRKHGDLLAETGVFKVWNNSEEEDINLSDMGYTLTYDDSLEDLLESQDPWMWPYGLFEEQRLSCDTTTDVDDAALLNAVKNLSFVKEGNPAVDAKLEKQGNDIVIVPSEMGTKLDPSRLEAAIKKALFAGEFSVDGSQYVERPKLTEDNEGLLFQRDRFNEYKNASLRVDMTGAEEVITGDMFADWLMTDGTSIGWDREKVGAYVQQCAEKYNTYGSVRNFNATGIGVIQERGNSPGCMEDTRQMERRQRLRKHLYRSRYLPSACLVLPEWSLRLGIRLRLRAGRYRQANAIRRFPRMEQAEKQSSERTRL